MLSANINAQTILNASSKEVSWLFEIDSDAGILYWSTKNYTYNGNNFINKIIPASFSGVQLNSSISNNNIMFPASGSFQFIDEENTYQVSCENFLDKKFLLRLVLKYSTYEECICSWLFSIEKARYNKGIVTIEYKDFFSRYLKGTYPNTPRISSLSPSDEALPNDNMCIPIFFGTAYIPIRCLYITDKRYYLLGPNDVTYDIDEFRSPIDWTSKSIWDYSYTYTQETKTLNSIDYKVVSPIIVDSNNDGTLDSAGLFYKDNRFLDAQIKLTRSDTASLTNFSDVIKYLLKDFGIPYYYIDQAEVKGQILSWDYCVLNLLSDWFKVEADSSFSFEGDHYELVSSSVSSNNYFGKTLSGISIIKDNWYSVSVDVKETAGTGAYFNVCMNEGTGAIEHIAPINYEIPYGGLYVATTEWKTYDLLFKASSSVTTGSIGIQINDPGKTLQIRNIILNKINFVDDCQTDNTADWTRIGSNGTLTYEMEDIGGGLFDTHYLFSTSTTVSLPNYSLANGFAKTNLTFLKGKYYKISCYVKDGTATGVSIRLRISPWGSLPFSSDAIVTNGTWQKLEYYYYVFTDNYESGSVGFYSRESLGGGNIKIKDFRFHEVSSFEYFRNKFDELGLFFNGGFFAIEDRVKILSSVLIQCGSILRITDKIELWQLDNRLKTIYDYQIRSKGEGQESTFNYRQNEKDFYDYGYVAFPEADSPQMILKQKGIFIDQDKIAEPISSLTVLKDVIEIPHVSDSENAQKAGIVYLQRKNGVEETITLDCRDDLVVTQPDDMVLFNDLEYGIRPVGVGSYNSYNLTVQQVHIKPDLTISLQLLKFIHPILNWDDLSVNVVTIETDDSPATTIYKTITAGPDDDTGQNKVDSRVRIGNNIILDGEKGLITIGEGLISRVWSFQTTEKEPNYSTAIGPYTVLDGTTPRKAILFCSQNWVFYALDVDTGEEIWNQINDGAMYGRMQAVDLEGTGDLKIYVPCNAGHIKRVDADGEYDSAFTFYNVYDREGSGTVTSVGAGYIIDSSQNWHDNAFIRIPNPTTQDEADTNAEVSFTSGVANGSSARISLISSGNKLDLYGGVPAGVAPGDTFIINPAYVSDKIFMHAGQLIKEGSIWYLYTTSQDSHIYKINAHTGALIWKYAGLEAAEAWPWIGDLFQDSGQYVLWGCYDKHLRCHNATTGAVIWDVELDGLLDGTPQVAPTGTGGKYEIYQASRSGKIFKLDRDDGSILAESGRPQYWQDIASTARPLKRSDNTWMVYIGGRRGDFGAYDCTDMYPIWKKNVTPDNINSSAVFHDVAGYGNLDVIVADMTGTIHIFHEDGMKICEVYCKGAIEGTPLIADIDDDGKVEMVVTTCDGWVHCFRFTNGTDNGFNGECPDVITMPIPPDI